MDKMQVPVYSVVSPDIQNNIGFDIKTGKTKFRIVRQGLNTLIALPEVWNIDGSLVLVKAVGCRKNK